MFNFRKKYTSKTEQDLTVITDVEVVEIEEKNKIYRDKLKNVFYCADRNGNTKMCILWGYSTFNVGDVVEMRGRYNGETFICRRLYIRRRTTQC